MKLPENPKSKKEKVKKKRITKEKKGQVLIVAQEIKFARLLSGNEKKTRDRVLKTLKKWLLNCFAKNYEFKESDFIRIWKGLFYAVWMSDKPLVQEELCESIAEILDHFPGDHMQHAMLMTKAGFHVLAKEWYGIDQHRMDKFLMLVRRYLRGSLRCLQRASWSTDSCKMFADILSASDGILSIEVPQYARNATSMILHFMDCYLEEISKVSQGEISSSSILELVSPLCTLLVHGTSPALVAAARRCLCSLIKQSETGIEYNERIMAWKSMGCPEGGPDALELEENDDEEQQDGDSDIEETRALDPRAGRVSVTLSPLPVPASGISDLLTELLRTASSKAQMRTRITAERFKQLSKQQYPYKVEIPDKENLTFSSRDESERSAHNLRRLEKTLLAGSDELALRGLRRKHRKRLLARARSGISIVDDAELNKTETSTENGEWKVEPTEPPAKKTKHTNKQEEITNKTKLPNKKTKQKHQKQTIDKNKTKQNVEIKQKKNKEIKQIVNKKINEIKEKKIKNEQEKVKHSSEKQVKTKNYVELKTPNKNNIDKKVLEIKKSPNKNIDKKIAELKKTHTDDKKIIKKTTKDIHKVDKVLYETPKKVKFVLKNNGMQGTVDYYKSVRQSPSIPYDGNKQPIKTNLKVSTPSPINPFFKKKLRKMK